MKRHTARPIPAQSGGGSEIRYIRQLAVKLSGTHFRVWLALAELTERKPSHSISISERILSVMAGVSKSCLPVALRALEGEGLITVERGDRRTQNTYTVNFPETPETEILSRFNASHHKPVDPNRRLSDGDTLKIFGVRSGGPR